MSNSLKSKEIQVEEITNRNGMMMKLLIILSLAFFSFSGFTQIGTNTHAGTSKGISKVSSLHQMDVYESVLNVENKLQKTYQSCMSDPNAALSLKELYVNMLLKETIQFSICEKVDHTCYFTPEIAKDLYIILDKDLEDFIVIEQERYHPNLDAEEARAMAKYLKEKSRKLIPAGE